MEGIRQLLYLMVLASVGIMLGLVWAVSDTAWEAAWPIGAFMLACAVVLGFVLGVMP